MLTLDDVLPLVGAPLDKARIARLLGTTGERSASEFDEDHPEDQRHYYTVAPLGLEMILDGDAIDTIFFNPPGDAAGHRWTMRNGLNHRSSRQAVLAALGTPERSAPPDPPGTDRIGFDRFPVAGVLLHFEYADDGESVELITAMRPSTAPRRRM